MGLSASKRVESSLTNSTEFDSACDSAYNHCLSLTQHAFQGVLPYQLLTASDHIYQTLFHSQPHNRGPQPLILKWVPQPPTRAQVDSALKKVSRHHHEKQHGSEDESLDVLGPPRFKEWAVVLYADAVVGNAGKALLSRVPIGVAGIAGVGLVTRSGKDLIGTAIGVYALGVVTSIYLSLSGNVMKENNRSTKSSLASAHNTLLVDLLQKTFIFILWSDLESIERLSRWNTCIEVIQQIVVHDNDFEICEMQYLS